MAVNVAGLIGMVAFYILILAVGLWAARKRKTGEEEAMLAGRSIGVFVGAFTLTATWVGGGYINGTAEVVYSDKGLIWCQAPWGYGLSLSLGGLFFAKIMREREYITMLDPFQDKYGSRMGALLYIPALCGELFWSGAILNALGATVSVILGLERTLSVIVSACIVIVYTMFGGLYAVAYTDVIQLICILVGLLLSIPFAMRHSAVSSISSTSSNWLGSWSPTKAGIWFDDAFLLMFGGIPWQVYFQRVLSCKTPRKAQILSGIGSLGCIVLAIPAIVIGAIGASTDWTQTELYSPPSPNATNYTMTMLKPEKSLILPLVLQYLTPTWVGVIGLGAVSAAVMSSADSSFLSASTMFAHNIYKPLFRQKASTREVIWVMRVGVIGAGVLASSLALSVRSIYALFYLCGDLVFVMLFPQLCCVIYVRHANVYGSFAGYIVGLFLRVAGGERIIGAPAFIHYPYYSDTHGQLFPYKSLAMVCTFITIPLVSYLAKYLFENEILPASIDFCHVFHGYDLDTQRKEIELKNNNEDNIQELGYKEKAAGEANVAFEKKE